MDFEHEDFLITNLIQKIKIRQRNLQYFGDFKEMVRQNLKTQGKIYKLLYEKCEIKPQNGGANGR